MSQSTDLQDMLNVCRCKLAFLACALSQPHQPQPEFSHDGWQGFVYIMWDIDNELEFVVNEMAHGKEEQK